MEIDVLHYRPDFEKAKDLLIRIQVYLGTLEKLDEKWSGIKNDRSSDFSRIYSFKQDKCVLEWFYNEGRQLTYDLRYNLELYMQPERMPTFKSFIDHMELNWVKHLPDLKSEFEEKAKLVQEVSGVPYAVVPMSLNTFGDVLRIFDGIKELIDMAKNNDLYKMESGDNADEQKQSSGGGVHFHGDVGNVANVVGEANHSDVSAEQGVVAATGHKKVESGFFGKLVGLIKGFFA